jgi:glycosyltransferase involved in cell wall biosynthesis
VPADNLAARVVERSGGGVVVEPGDTPAFLAAAETLLADQSRRDELGARARAYAATSFDIAEIAGRFESVLEAARR